MTLWLFKQRVSVGCVYGRYWESPVFSISNNGGRLADECFDLNVNLWRLGFSFTLWHIGAWSKLLRYLPDNARCKQ